MKKQIDLSKPFEFLPPNSTVESCYRAIYGWHKKHGVTAIVKDPATRFFGKPNDPYVVKYGQVVSKLRSPENAKEIDMYFVFNEVMRGTFEWAFGECDDLGCPMAAYANFGRSKLGPKYEEELRNYAL